MNLWVLLVKVQSETSWVATAFRSLSISRVVSSVFFVGPSVWLSPYLPIKPSKTMSIEAEEVPTDVRTKLRLATS